MQQAPELIYRLFFFFSYYFFQMSKHRKKQSIFSFSDDEEDQPMVSVKPLPNHAVERSELIAEEFNPDRFLSSRRHLGLERMKVELNTHLKQLKAELVELINKDYQDFVNLSTNLKGVDKDINELKQPLYKIENQVKVSLLNIYQITISKHEQKGCTSSFPTSY